MSTFLGWNGPQWLNLLSGVMAVLVMVDALVGHYRSGFAVKAQYAPFIAGTALVVAVVMAASLPGRAWVPLLLFAAGLLAVATGIAGAGFHHYYGIVRRPGGYSWLLHHLMYGAPPLAPLALSAVGALAMVAAVGLHGGDSLLGVPLQVAALGIVAASLLGAALQAAVLHYRGAFNHPLMYAPLTAPVLAAAMIPWLVAGRGRWAAVALAALLWGTFLLGFVGLGMHLRGFDRMMGGLRVALPNVLEGPAAAAPALFSGLAAAGLVALHLL